MTTERLVAFALLQLTFAVTPGPTVVLVVAHAMNRGWRAGLRAALGSQVGNMLYLALSALGAGLLLRASPVAFQVLKVAGAGYLAWTGLRSIQRALSGAKAPPRSHERGAKGAFASGLAGQLANPKSIIFFGALLPLFVAPGASFSVQYALLAAVCVVIELPILAAYAGVAAATGRVSDSAKSAKMREIISGACLVSVSVLLATVPLGTA